MNETPRVGIFAKTLDPGFIEVAGQSGLDFLIIDMEHGPADMARVHDHVRALALTPAKSFIRVAGVDSNAIGAALDTGANGILVPNVQNAEQARQAVRAARFHPEGSRGVCRYVRAAGFGQQPSEEYFASANRARLACQIEGTAAIENLDEILSVEGMDILFIGPYDLSQSFGCPGQLDSPQLLEAVADIADRAGRKNLQLAAFSDNPKLTSLLQESGVTMLACSVDVAVFRLGIERLLNQHRHD